MSKIEKLFDDLQSMADFNDFGDAQSAAEAEGWAEGNFLSALSALIECKRFDNIVELKRYCLRAVDDKFLESNDDKPF